MPDLGKILFGLYCNTNTQYSVKNVLSLSKHNTFVNIHYKTLLFIIFTHGVRPYIRTFVRPSQKQENALQC